MAAGWPYFLQLHLLQWASVALLLAQTGARRAAWRSGRLLDPEMQAP
ncbi:MAG TPA: hypothetical protein VFC15_04650 [Candidatus Limnocylindrales bacterium]|nr:hypothetical protein [Candidatus Limnocylindrales bacterium]